MTRLAQTAEQVLSAAEAMESGPVTILMRDARVIWMTNDCAWSLDALLNEHTAEEAFRVGRRNGKLFVEARSRSQFCLVASRTQEARKLIEPPFARLLMAA